MGGNDRLHLNQVGVEEVEVFLRAHRLRQGGEVADVGEQDRHLAFDLLPEFDLANVVDSQQREKLARDETRVGLCYGIRPITRDIGMVLCAVSGRLGDFGHAVTGRKSRLRNDLESK